MCELPAIAAAISKHDGRYYCHAISCRFHEPFTHRVVIENTSIRIDNHVPNRNLDCGHRSRSAHVDQLTTDNFVAAHACITDPAVSDPQVGSGNGNDGANTSSFFGRTWCARELRPGTIRQTNLHVFSRSIRVAARVDSTRHRHHSPLGGLRLQHH